YQVTATGLPDSYDATPIPPNLSFNNVQGIIGGVPNTPGTTQVQLTGTNSAGTGSPATLTITVQPAPSSGPVIISGTSITARTGQPFNFRVLTKNATSAARLDASDLPPGLTADPVTGIISGKPTSDGGFGVTLTVTDGAARTQGILQITCVSDPAFPVITSPGAAILTPGQFFSYTITAPGDTDPSDPTTFSIIGALPAGLSFNSQTGTISGVYTGVAHSLTNAGTGSRPDLAGESGPHSDGGLPSVNETPLVGITGLVTHNNKGTGTKPLDYFPPTAIPTIGLAASSTSVNEGASATFIFSSSIVDPVNVKTVHYQMSGKAKSGTDYTLSVTSGQIDIPAGASSATITLTALTDMVPKEKNETVIMSLSKVAKKGAPYVLSAAKKVTVTIVNVP
ncbi:MAG: Immunoglobulin I-set domain protein, partial [Spartobacteria bacterium]|nr:Immunoglobulin I-set domain protein [Spartobacteria bacterium]